MIIKKLIKKLGRNIIVLKEEERGIRQSVLMVDNGYSHFEHVFSCIETINNCFPQAEFSVLTFEHRKDILKKEFPNLKFIIPAGQSGPKRYQIALEVLRMRRRRFDFILLLSLDITPLLASLLFTNSDVILHNQWRQWWSIRLRRVTELFKITYIDKKKSFGLKNLARQAGLFFVLLQQNGAGLLRHSVLIVDNSYASCEHIYCVVDRTIKSLPQARITLLTSAERGELKNKFPAVEFIEPDDYIFKKYRIARAVLNFRNCRDYTVLLSLDITPIIASLLFSNSRVFLYNQWHQWWSLKPKPIRDYLIVIPKFILTIIINIIIFVYLLISVSWIFLKKSFNVFKSNLSIKES